MRRLASCNPLHSHATLLQKTTRRTNPTILLDHARHASDKTTDEKNHRDQTADTSQPTRALPAPNLRGIVETNPSRRAPPLQRSLPKSPAEVADGAALSDGADDEQPRRRFATPRLTHKRREITTPAVPDEVRKNLRKSAPRDVKGAMERFGSALPEQPSAPSAPSAKRYAADADATRRRRPPSFSRQPKPSSAKAGRPLPSLSLSERMRRQREMPDASPPSESITSSSSSEGPPPVSRLASLASRIGRPLETDPAPPPSVSGDGEQEAPRESRLAELATRARLPFEAVASPEQADAGSTERAAPPPPPRASRDVSGAFDRIAMNLPEDAAPHLDLGLDLPPRDSRSGAGARDARDSLGMSGDRRSGERMAGRRDMRRSPDSSQEDSDARPPAARPMYPDDNVTSDLRQRLDRAGASRAPSAPRRRGRRDTSARGDVDEVDDVDDFGGAGLFGEEDQYDDEPDEPTEPEDQREYDVRELFAEEAFFKKTLDELLPGGDEGGNDAEQEQALEQLRGLMGETSDLGGPRFLSKELYKTLNDSDKLNVYNDVLLGSQWLPMRVPKPKGLAKLLQPEGEVRRRVDFDGVHGLHIQDFADPEAKAPVGRYRPSKVDRFLSHHEEMPTLFEPPRRPLSSVDEWFDALGLAADDPRRTEDRTVRYFAEMSKPRITDEQRSGFLEGLRDAYAFIDEQLAKQEEAEAKSEK